MPYLMLDLREGSGHETINAKEIFGKDTERLFKACRWLRDHYGNLYEGCYEPNIPMPTFAGIKEKFQNELKRDPTVAEIKKERDLAMDDFFKSNPEELEKVRRSRRNRDIEWKKKIYTVCAIANSHRVFIKWLGEDRDCCQPDKWIVCKGHKQIGVIVVQSVNQ